MLFSVRLLPVLSLSLVAGALAFGCAADEPTSNEEAGDYGGESVDAPVTAQDLTAAHAVANLKSLAPVTKKLAAPTTALLPVGETLAGGTTVTAVRSLTLEGTAAYLVVQEGALRSFVVKKTDFDAGFASDGTFLQTLRGRAQSPITKVNVTAPATEMTVTIDMCQSSKAWDVKLYDWLRQVSAATGKPVPVGVAMTGGWAKSHETQLKQLLKWQKSKELDIVWINHSYTHPLNCNAARTSCAFLTAGSVNFESEVLKNEELLMSQGAVPSALFRFPGLVHNQTRRAQLNQLSLFAVDSDTWLAKGHKAQDGSLILVHGNGNEPPGISKFFSLATQNRWLDEARAGRMVFVSPLRGIAASAQ